MSVFDPNEDYTKNDSKDLDPASIYATVVEVQQLLQEITALLQMQEACPNENASQFRQPLINSDADPKQEINLRLEEQIDENELLEGEDEETSTIYDDIFA